MTTTDMLVALYRLAAIRLADGQQFRADMISATATQISELTDSELAIVGLQGETT